MEKNNKIANATKTSLTRLQKLCTTLAFPNDIKETLKLLFDVTYMYEHTTVITPIKHECGWFCGEEPLEEGHEETRYRYEIYHITGQFHKYRLTVTDTGEVTEDGKRIYKVWKQLFFN